MTFDSLMKNFVDYAAECPQGVTPAAFRQRFNTSKHQQQEACSKLLAGSQLDAIGSRSTRRYFHPKYANNYRNLLDPADHESTTDHIRSEVESVFGVTDPVTAREIRELTGLSKTTVERQLRIMITTGIIRRVDRKYTMKLDSDVAEKPVTKKMHQGPSVEERLYREIAEAVLETLNAPDYLSHEGRLAYALAVLREKR